MNHEFLASFVVFSEHCNFTRAAETLHISQPALHAQIRKLGEAVGVPLYYRAGRDLHLTQEGKRLAAFGRDLQGRTVDFLADLTGAGSASRVTLASGEGAYLYLLGQALARFQRTKWQLNLVTTNAVGAVDAVRNGQADIAVTALSDLPEDLDTTHLVEIGQMLVVPKKHRLGKRRSVSPVDLADERIVVAPEGAPHRSSLTSALRLAGVEWEAAASANGWELMLHFASLGFGITVVNDFCRVPQGMHGVMLTGIAPIDYYIVERRGSASPGARHLRDLISGRRPRSR
jgi:DNA-binding transcriptional LysR family regulator